MFHVEGEKIGRVKFHKQKSVFLFFFYTFLQFFLKFLRFVTNKLSVYRTMHVSPDEKYLRCFIQLPILKFTSIRHVVIHTTVIQ